MKILSLQPQRKYAFNSIGKKSQTRKQAEIPLCQVMDTSSSIFVPGLKFEKGVRDKKLTKNRCNWFIDKSCQPQNII